MKNLLQDQSVAILTIKKLLHIHISQAVENQGRPGAKENFKMTLQFVHFSVLTHFYTIPGPTPLPQNRAPGQKTPDLLSSAIHISMQWVAWVNKRKAKSEQNQIRVNMKDTCFVQKQLLFETSDVFVGGVSLAVCLQQFLSQSLHFLKVVRSIRQIP